MNFWTMFASLAIWLCGAVSLDSFACEVAEKKDLNFEEAYCKYQEALYKTIGSNTVSKESLSDLSKDIIKYKESDKVYVRNSVFFVSLKLKELEELINIVENIKNSSANGKKVLEEMLYQYDDDDPCFIYLSSVYELFK